MTGEAEDVIDISPGADGKADAERVTTKVVLDARSPSRILSIGCNRADGCGFDVRFSGNGAARFDASDASGARIGGSIEPGKVTMTPLWTSQPSPFEVRLNATGLTPDASVELSVSIDTTPQLVRSNQCLSCHAIEKVLVGPSFRDIAARYRTSTGVAERLVGKLKTGSQWSWGAVPMPAQTQVSDTHARTLVSWILSLP